MQYPFVVSSIVLFIIVLFGLNNAYADVYRWRDSEGEWVYGDEPPGGIESERIEMKAIPASGTRLATPEEIKKEIYETKSNQSSNKKTKISSHCRRYISELNKIEVYLEHSYTQMDALKAKDKRKLIRQECGSKIFKMKFEDSRCTGYRQKLARIEIHLQHSKNHKDAQTAGDLKERLKRECR